MNAALTLAAPFTVKPGCFLATVYLGNAQAIAECRWEGGDEEDPTAIVVVEGVMFNGHLVRAKDWPESLLDQWGEEVAAYERYESEQMALSQAIDAVQAYREAA